MPAPSDQVSTLRQLLNAPDDDAACRAARELAKMRVRACEAVDDLIAAATSPWKFGCPQRFPDAINALLKIAPEDPRLIPVIQATIRCSNYGTQKACVVALLTIGTAAAIDTVYNLDQYWRAAPKSAAFKKLMYKVLGEIEQRGMDRLIPASENARAGLIDRLEGRRQGPPCPYCGQPLRTNLAKQCFHCGRSWHA